MNDAPLSIRRFEVLQITSVIVGLLHGFAVMKADLFSLVASAAMTLVFTLLVSRGRKNWARWAILALFLLGLVIMIAAEAFELWQTGALFWVGYPPLIALVWLLQAAALYLLFTPQTSSWFRETTSKA